MKITMDDRDKVLVKDTYSMTKAQESFPDKEIILVKGDAEKEYEKIKKTHNVFIYQTKCPLAPVHINRVGMLTSSRNHGYISH